LRNEGQINAQKTVHFVGFHFSNVVVALAVVVVVLIVIVGAAVEVGGKIRKSLCWDL
jgi:hypothetical protein